MKINKIRPLLLLLLLFISAISMSCGYKYDVTNEYFKVVSKSVSKNYNPEEDENCPYLKITVVCPFALEAVKAYVKIYNNDNVIYDETLKTEGDFLSNDDIYLTTFIPDDVYSKYDYIEVELKGASKDNSIDKDATCTVTFVNNNGKSNTVKTVKIGECVDSINDPTKENHQFMYWCTDVNLVYKYNFSTPVLGDLVLYAKYSVNYADLTNIITTKIMKSNVTVYAKNIKKVIFELIPVNSQTHTGSGIIFYESSGYYYVLTNNHVTVEHEGFNDVEYTIEDYLGNKYEATEIHMSASYDLAVLKFKKKDNLNVIKLASSNPSLDAEVVSLGQPKGQTNAISYGEITTYVAGPALNNCEDYESKVRFDVIKHNAYMRPGSSGGALLDTELKLIGINYASNSSDDFKYGLSIPIEKINEYLKKYFWK